MSSLSSLKDTSRAKSKHKRCGRGMGTGKGKTSGRGQKGQGARSGYKRRYGKEGGQFPLYRKLPTRGFTRGKFRQEYDVINLDQIEMLYNDGEEVNVKSLQERGFIDNPSKKGLKILGNGNLTKKVSIHAHSVSTSAREKLQKAKIALSLVE